MLYVYHMYIYLYYNTVIIVRDSEEIFSFTLAFFTRIRRGEGLYLESSNCLDS